MLIDHCISYFACRFVGEDVGLKFHIDWLNHQRWIVLSGQEYNRQLLGLHRIKHATMHVKPFMYWTCRSNSIYGTFFYRWLILVCSPSFDGHARLFNSWWFHFKKHLRLVSMHGDCVSVSIIGHDSFLPWTTILSTNARRKRQLLITTCITCVVNESPCAS